MAFESKDLEQREGETGRGEAAHLVRRHFSVEGRAPEDQVEWERRTAQITGEGGAVVFEQAGVEVPRTWSALATNVVASKYLRGALGSPEREHSVRQLVGRVVRTIARWGLDEAYFATAQDAAVFGDELAALVYGQRMSFNSPVWFNVGVEEHPQCSACFINGVEDSMDAILRLAHTEGMLFKYGSGAGTNLSRLRSSKEKLRGGGEASGPVSFMRGFDAFAGVIKSGGKTRRAAKMVILDVDHPDIVEFITCKAEEEKKAHALIGAGYDGGFNVRGGAYDSVFFQNANHSVRVSDAFLKAVEEDREWYLTARCGGAMVDRLRARELMRQIAEAAWVCGDPGVQFDTTINSWNTVPRAGRINASNPCSEYLGVDDSACNLASLNLLTFLAGDGTFDVVGFQRAVELTLLAQEIIVGKARYPTPAIAANSVALRPLGLGYANLGALLMALGVPYDSEEGRRWAGAVTALMTGTAFGMSARLAALRGPFEAYEANQDAVIGVLRRHAAAAGGLVKGRGGACDAVVEAAGAAWWRAVEQAQRDGVRNSQVTVLAPTGTIGFMMDCDTTGIEPGIGLVSFKKLVGGGTMRMVNTTVPVALRRLGYDEPAVASILQALEETGTLEGCAALAAAHLPVFDCALRPMQGTRAIHYMGHVRMMAAVQPFLSGAISKTVNMPHDATVEDIEDAYLAAWRMGLKALAVYRDGCKSSQPVSTGARAGQAGADDELKARRKRLPDERRSITHKFNIGAHEGYMTVGMYDDGDAGELFVTMAKEGSVVNGLMDAFATMTSVALQYGVPLHVLVGKFAHTRFEPSGFTGNAAIPIAKSIPDYIFRWLALKFLPREDVSEGAGPEAGPEAQAPAGRTAGEYAAELDAPACPNCGDMMVRNGACYKCGNCGGTSGCS